MRSSKENNFMIDNEEMSIVTCGTCVSPTCDSRCIFFR